MLPWLQVLGEGLVSNAEIDIPVPGTRCRFAVVPNWDPPRDVLKVVVVWCQEHGGHGVSVGQDW